jgi:hypothetical protein
MRKFLRSIYLAFVITSCHDANSHDINNSKSDSTPSSLADQSTSKDSTQAASTIDLSRIKPSFSFGNNEAVVKIKSINLSNQFIFDRYGDEWRYVNAERGTKIVAISTSITSKSKDPSLPPIIAYSLTVIGF